MKKKKTKKPVRKAVKKVRKKTVKKKIAKKPETTPRLRSGQGAQKPVKKSSIPEGASLEEVGIVTHYFPKVDAAVVKLTKGTLSIGDTIFIKGHTSDFKEKVESIQLEHVPITTAEMGQEIGLKVKSRVREHDIVYKLIG